jgi:hypothetical protein
MGVNDQFALQTSWIADVRFGSKADIGAPPINVRFTPKSGHWNSVLKCTAANSRYFNHLVGARDPRTNSQIQLRF